MDDHVNSGAVQQPDIVRQKALAACGKFSGPEDLAEDHDRYLVKAYGDEGGNLSEESRFTAENVEDTQA